jgi:hypothetical protein
MTLMKMTSFAMLLAVLPLQSQHPTKPPVDEPDRTGRYQMTALTLDNGEKTALLLDTATGRVWKYQEGFESKDAEGKSTFTPPRFIVIPVDDLSK